jgi:uncharacterized protein (DUF952 family)
MRVVYHLLLRTTWEQAPPGPYRAASLASEGFIHLSNASQVAAAANRFYVAEEDLLLLHVDATRLTSPLRDEPAASGELFPHVHGPLDRTAIIAVETLRRGLDGDWVFSNPSDPGRS